MSEIALMSLQFLPTSALGLSAIAVLVGCGSTNATSEAEDTSGIAMENPAQWVDPFIGTDRMGHTYPGATVPYGMVQLSPQTRFEPYSAPDGGYNPDTYRYCAGYQYGDSTILGFAHTAFSGTGHSDLGDLLLMPTVGRPDLTSDGRGGPRFGSGFSHAAEDAEPGYYTVELERYGVLAELTASPRTGQHRYTFHDGGRAHLAVDLAYNIYHHPDKNVWTFLRVEDDSTVVGYRQTTGWGRTRLVHFALRFDRPLVDYGCEKGQPLAYNGFYRRFDEAHGFPEMAGRDLRCWFDFGELNAGEQLGVRVGLSSVDTRGALANLEHEAPSERFDHTREEARTAWNDAMAVARIRPMEKDALLRAGELTTFCTALYHSMLSPVLYQDVDGRYRGLDQNIHTAEGFTNHTVFSLWDTYRALHPWINLTQPDKAADLVESMLAHAHQSVHGMLPIWSHHANENWCMIGYHAVSVLADAAAHDVPDFPMERALAAAESTARVRHFDGLGSYLDHGYFPMNSATAPFRRPSRSRTTTGASPGSPKPPDRATSPPSLTPGLKATAPIGTPRSASCVPSSSTVPSGRTSTRSTRMGRASSRETRGTTASTCHTPSIPSSPGKEVLRPSLPTSIRCSPWNWTTITSKRPKTSHGTASSATTCTAMSPATTSPTSTMPPDGPTARRSRSG